MKKRLCMLLIAALLLMLVPHVASANAPIPWYIEISCENVEAGTQIEVVFQREDGTTRTQIANGTTGTIGMDYESDETSFYLVCTAPDGTETRTASVQLVSWGCYRYDGATNSLSANGTYYPRGNSCADGVLTAVLIVLVFVLPLGLTLPFALMPAGKAAPRFALFAALIALALSVAIEAVQYAFALGRCETDDVLSNVVGAAFGASACLIYCLLSKHRHE